MPEYVVTIGSPPTQVSFKVSDESELDDRLEMAKSLLELIKTVSQPPSVRIPKHGMAHIYGFTPDGRLELIKVPGKSVYTVFLALYCYDPDAVTYDQLVECTGLTQSNVSGFLSQNPYNKYVYKPNPGLFRLSHKGKVWVISKVLPSLGMGAPVTEEDPSDKE